MLRSVSFTIQGKPIPLKRHRTAKGGRTYDSQKKEKLLYGAIIKQSMPHYHSFQEKLLASPLQITVEFYLPLPQSKKNKQQKGLYHSQKPDLDNLLKFILDVMSGILYEDDANICQIDTIKCYSYNPRTKVIVKEINQKENPDGFKQTTT